MKWLMRLIALAALAVVLYLFWPLLLDLRDSGELLRQARWSWLAAAVLIQIVSYSFLAALNYLLLRPFPGQISFLRVMGVLPAMAFIEVAVPSAGASGLVLRARLLGRSGYSPEASTFTLALETLYLSLIMVGVALIGVVYMLESGSSAGAQLRLLSVGGGLLLAAGGGIAWLGRDRQRAGRWLLALVGWRNRLAGRLGRRPASVEAVGARVALFYDGLAQLGQIPRWPLWLTAVARVTLDVASLGACFAAFNYAISPGVLLTGYGLMLLLSTLAALPGGLGLADASLAVIYAGLGAPGAVAVAASLAYRMIAFWLVRFAGFVSWQLLESAS